MSGVRVVVQCRLLSSRLPAKALLPIGGIPAAALCALRARNRGLDVVAAVGDGAADDVLARELAAHGIPVVRGSEADVLGRFVAATGDLPPEATVVRLTGDNPVPDGDFIAGLLDAFRRAGGPYLGTHSPRDGLPYGLSAEAFTVAELRRADGPDSSPADREHVTPAMRRRFAAPPLLTADDLGLPDLSHLRVTLDTADDYVRLHGLFDGCDPVVVPWRDLVERLRRTPGVPAARIPYRVVEGHVHGAVALGAAQLGMRYGAASRGGPPSPREATRIVRAAVERGVTHIDTARAYGDSEARVGAALEGGWSARVHVVTKLSPLAELPDDADAARVAEAVDASVFRSCRELRMATLPTLLLHRAVHRTSHGGAVWARLLALREQGVIGRLGVSVQTTDEAAAVLRDPEVKHVQLPFNLLDRRWRRAGVDRMLAGRPDVTVHARSVLLQGLLAADSAEPWPRVAGYDRGATVDAVRAQVRELGREGPLDLCFAYARAQRWIHGVLVGIASHAELMENVALFDRPPLGPEECARVESAFGGLPEALLNPALWPRD